MKSVYSIGIGLLFLFAFTFTTVLTSVAVADQPACECCTVYCPAPYGNLVRYVGHDEPQPAPGWCNSQPSATCPDQPSGNCLHFTYGCPQ